MSSWIVLAIGSVFMLGGIFIGAAIGSHVTRKKCCECYDPNAWRLG